MSPAFLYRLLGYVAVAALIGVSARGRLVFAAPDTQIPFVGLDSNGHSQVHYLPGSQYLQNLATVISTVDASVKTAIQNMPSTGSTWQLRTVGVGVGASMMLTLGPIGKVTVSPRVSLLFGDGSVINPVPDIGVAR